MDKFGTRRDLSDTFAMGQKKGESDLQQQNATPRVIVSDLNNFLRKS